MNSFILDSLLSRSNGDTFYFDHGSCHNSLLLEAILRGFQVQHLLEFYYYDTEKRTFWAILYGEQFDSLESTSGCGISLGSGDGVFGDGCGKDLFSNDMGVWAGYYYFGASSGWGMTPSPSEEDFMDTVVIATEDYDFETSCLIFNFHDIFSISEYVPSTSLPYFIS